MSRENFPLYQKGIGAYLSHDVQAFEKYLRHPDLSMRERGLLKARKYIRAKKWSQALQVLEKISESSASFLSGEKYFLLASCNFFQNRMEESAACNQRALGFYQVSGDRRGQFLANYNLSVDFGQLGLRKISHQYLAAAQILAIEAGEKNLILRALACENSKIGKYQEACKILTQALATIEALSVHDRFATQCVAADVFARAGKFDQARQQLESISANRLNIDSARTFFELKLLEFLTSRDMSIFSKLPKAIDSSPEYSLKWKFLSALGNGEQASAIQFWQQLSNSHPGTFGEFLLPKKEEEERDLFFQAIQKMCGIRPVATAAPSSSSALIEKLEKVLRGAAMPLRKEELIEKIWNIPYSPAYDSRFYKLLERVRKLSKSRIVCERRSYRML